MKRILAFLLVLVMVFSLVACAEESSSRSKRRSTKPTISETDDRDDDDDDDDDNKGHGQIIVDPDALPYEMDESGRVLDGYFNGVEIEWWISSNYDLNSNMYLFKKLEEVIGCKINLVRYDSETYQTKINAALNTNSLPDMCAMAFDHNLYNVYGEQGAFVNLMDPTILSRMPNMKKAILDNPEAAALWEAYKSENGGLYSFPRYDTERAVNFGWMYREDIFEKHGIKMWHDSESFLNVLRQLKTLYPDSYPLTGASMSSIFDRLMNNYGVNAMVMAYDWSKNEWFLGASTEAYYEMMCVFQTAWNEDLVDPDIFTNNVNDIDATIINGTSFVFNSWIGRMEVQNYYGREYVDPNFQVSYAPHIGNGQGETLPTLSLTGTVVNAQSPEKEVEACLAIYNYLYSEEGTAVMTVGEEGVTFDTVNGERVYKNDDGTEMINPTIQTLEEQYGLWNSNIYPLASKDSVYFTYSLEEFEAQQIGSRNGLAARPPVINVPMDYAEEYYDMAHNLTLDIQQFCKRFITESYTRADWRAQCASWQTKYADLFAILNGTY